MISNRSLLFGLIVALTAIEAVFWIAEAGVLGADYRNLRTQALAYGAFWPGLLRDWQPNFSLQPVTMFVTYAMLHAGPIHLAMNMVTLLSLGQAAIARASVPVFLMIYAASVLGGGVGYGILAPGYQPMVGASGALFGLAGALLTWEYFDRRRLRMDSRPLLKAILLLVGVNVAMYWALDGRLAWQAHLGGTLAGMLAAWFINGTRLPDDRTA
jgi:rhomboid protease GluP